MIKQVRLDERLTHGQVNTKWISYLGATHVVVVDDESANNAFQTNLLKMSIPEKVKSMVVTCAKAIKDGKPLKYDSEANEILCVDGDNTALAIYRKENGVYRCVRGLL